MSSEGHCEKNAKTNVTVEAGQEILRWPKPERQALNALTRITSALTDFDAELNKPHTLVSACVRQPHAGPAAVVCYACAWLVANELQIVDVATDPDFLRQGCAHRVLLALLARARTEGCHVAMLEVRKSNGRALALYEALGFRELRIRTNYYRDGDDALELQLML